MPPTIAPTFDEPLPPPPPEEAPEEMVLPGAKTVVLWTTVVKTWPSLVVLC